MEPTEVVNDFVADDDSVVVESVDVVVDDVPVVVEPVEVSVDDVPVDVESIGVVVGAFSVEVEPVDVVVDAFTVVVEPVDIAVDPVAALLLVSLFSLFRVKPTLNPIVSATIANPIVPSSTNRLRRVDCALALARSYNGSAKIIVRK